jgi:hypothetical protein
VYMSFKEEKQWQNVNIFIGILPLL